MEAGENIYYYVKEVGDHSGYTVSYMNNGGIRSGEIVITNKVEEQPIVLPETGGTGTYWYTMGGVLLTAGAAFLIYKKSTCRKEAGEFGNKFSKLPKHGEPSIYAIPTHYSEGGHSPKNQKNG